MVASQSFFAELAKYYMDFLETDFHRRRLPKRSVKLTNDSNLRIGLNLKKYPQFEREVWKVVNKGFQGDAAEIEVKRKQFTKPVPQQLLNLVEEISGKLNATDLKKIQKEIVASIQLAAKSYPNHLDNAVVSVRESVEDIVLKAIIRPFLSKLEKPLEDQKLADIDTLYIVEEELRDVFLQRYDGVISSSLISLAAGTKIDVSANVENALDLAELIDTIRGYFRNLALDDLFSEIRELSDNSRLLEKQEMYLYLCDIKFGTTIYPIFYLPIRLDKEGDTFKLCFEPIVYINKKAVEFITQEYNTERGKRGVIEAVGERIQYGSSFAKGEEFSKHLSGILNHVTDYFDLPDRIFFEKAQAQKVESVSTRVSNNIYLCLSDRSDEALINDYEEILESLKISEDSDLAEAFMELVGSFMSKDPVSVISEVAEEWSETSYDDKLVFQSPIPLNEEQRQILSALRKDNCSYVLVEGPPGTGKSHTITAVVFDAILKNQSVLVLSDKKEALDVVEDKITSVINKVRIDKDFQNPILRLDSKNFGKILQNASIGKIRDAYTVARSEERHLKAEIESCSIELKKNILSEIEGIQGVDFKDLGKYFYYQKMEAQFSQNFNIEEIEKDLGNFGLLNELPKHLQTIQKLISTKPYKAITQWLEAPEQLSLINEMAAFASKVRPLVESLSQVEINYLQQIEDFDSSKILEVQQLLSNFDIVSKSWLGLGSFVKAGQLRVMSDEFCKKIGIFSNVEAYKNLLPFSKILDVYSQVMRIGKSWSLKDDLDSVVFIHDLIRTFDYIPELNEKEFAVALEKVESFIACYPFTAQQMGLEQDSLELYCSSKANALSTQFIEDCFSYISLKNRYEDSFNSLPEYNYVADKAEIEKQFTVQMTHIMDGRVLDFYDNHINTARELKKIFASKKKFPREEFGELKKAFPCIIAGIRDYAEYIPLEKGLFDLIIIDEASQVSIAQAFPALLRGKKILILGDDKQFPNVKSAQARSEMNQSYMTRLQAMGESSFKSTLAHSKIENFNIKKSVLDFFKRIRNYEAMLKKHFRGYDENISFSSKHYYGNALQSVKIRAKSLNDVLQIHLVEHDGKIELTPNTNSPEAEFILKALEAMKKADAKVSVGIITPHTNQQKYIASLIQSHKERDYFYDELKLKIMTFDTCQGEERDIVYYSMVATDESDRLSYIFPPSLKENDEDKTEEGGIKRARLNVGFSRVKESMRIVLSKPVDQFKGAVGDALFHYQSILDAASKIADVNEVDSSSPMEKKILQWIQQTEFFQENKEAIELKAQFKIGKLLKQLTNGRWNHPNFVSDFLMIYTDGSGKQQNLIIEYDGFEYHFQSHEDINRTNYRMYFTDEHVYRQKVIESYGYQFLRLNKFNLGCEPVSRLNEMLEGMLKKKFLKVA